MEATATATSDDPLEFDYRWRELCRIVAAGREPSHREFTLGTYGERTEGYDLDADAAAITEADVARMGLALARKLSRRRSHRWHRRIAARARRHEMRAEALKRIGDSPARAAAYFEAMLRRMRVKYPRLVSEHDYEPAT